MLLKPGCVVYLDLILNVYFLLSDQWNFSFFFFFSLVLSNALSFLVLSFGIGILFNKKASVTVLVSKDQIVLSKDTAIRLKTQCLWAIWISKVNNDYIK